MHAVERELIKATGYKTQRPFSNRQDYLGSILNAVMKLTDNDFDNLSDEAATWANAAVEAKNAKDTDLPDFDEAPVDDSEEPDAETSEDEVEIDPETGEVLDVAEDESEPEPEEEVSASKTVKHRKPPKEKETKTKPAPKRAASDDDVVLDKWGCMVGSKNAQALALFEKGATTKEVKDKIGGTYYNILGKAVQNGHKMEKEGSLIKLTHKDDIAVGKKPATKKR